MKPEPRAIAFGDLDGPNAGANVAYALPLAEGGTLLVDAGPDFDGAWEAMVAQGAVAEAAGHGFAPSDVRAVLVTHAHVDHAGLAHRWAKAGARILAGAADVRAIVTGGGEGGDAGSGAAAEEAMRVRIDALRRHGLPDGLLPPPGARRWRGRMRWAPVPAEAIDEAADGLTFALEGGASLRVVAAPGHTPGNLVAFIEATGDLFCGDTLLPRTIPTPGLHFDENGARWPSLPPFLASVRRLRELPARRALPGHGRPVEDAARLIDRFASHHARRARRIRALLAERPESAHGVVRRLFPHLPEPRVMQAMTEAIGHLDLLIEEDAAERTADSGGVWVYRLVD